jgi:hypothetical protein
LPTNYIGGPLNNTLTIPHQTFSSMGIDIGPYGFSKYVFRLDNTEQTVTVLFVTPGAAAPIPEPPTWALMLSSLGFLELMTRRRRRRQSTVVAPA